MTLLAPGWLTMAVMLTPFALLLSWQGWRPGGRADKTSTNRIGDRQKHAGLQVKVDHVGREAHEALCDRHGAGALDIQLGADQLLRISRTTRAGNSSVSRSSRPSCE